MSRVQLALRVADQAADAVAVTPEPPSARFCRVTHELLRSARDRARGRQLPLPATTTTPSTSAPEPALAGHRAGGSPEDWGTLTCCEQPARIAPLTTSLP